MKKAPTLYKGRIYKLKQLYLEKKPKPTNITDDVWNALVCHWKTEEAVEASRKAKKNRMSEVEPGAGISKTYGGSCSFAEMAARLVSISCFSYFQSLYLYYCFKNKFTC